MFWVYRLRLENELSKSPNRYCQIAQCASWEGDSTLQQLELQFYFCSAVVILFYTSQASTFTFSRVWKNSWSSSYGFIEFLLLVARWLENFISKQDHPEHCMVLDLYSIYSFQYKQINFILSNGAIEIIYLEIRFFSAKVELNKFCVIDLSEFSVYTMSSSQDT